MRIDFGKDCIGCGACVGACPEVFEFDTDVYKVKVNIGADFSQHMAAKDVFTALAVSLEKEYSGPQHCCGPEYFSFRQEVNEWKLIA